MTLAMASSKFTDENSNNYLQVSCFQSDVFVQLANFDAFGTILVKL